MKAEIVAIDGPAGSGKSTVAKMVAEGMGFLYVDTGAMYRALTLKAIEAKADFKDADSIIKLSMDMDIELVSSGNSLKVYLDKKDVTERIRTMQVTTNVKHVASLKKVRANMVKLQRRLAGGSSGAVLEGRDIGTVVFPDAAHKFYLDASVQIRTKRRFDELKNKGFNVSLEEVEKDVISRDKSDMTRKTGPLKKAPDATAIDTTGMTAEQVAERILGLLRPASRGSQ